MNSRQKKRKYEVWTGKYISSRDAVHTPEEDSGNCDQIFQAKCGNFEQILKRKSGIFDQIFKRKCGNFDQILKEKSSTKEHL